MRVITVNRIVEIIKGALKGKMGNVISFDSEIDKVGIQLDSDTVVIVPSDNINQYKIARSQ